MKNFLWWGEDVCFSGLKGSNYHNHFLKIVSRFFTEVEGSMTFSCIKQGFVVFVSDQRFLLPLAHTNVATSY